MKGHQSVIGKNDEWLTPPEILQALGPFDLDPCAPAVRPWDMAKSHYSEDGLMKTWYGRVWCNPPFNRYERPKWMKAMSDHGNGILLIPAATETEAFYQFVWFKATAICFLRSRPHFHYADGRRASFNCGTAIALAAYGNTNASYLTVSQLGKVVTP
jgi:hypothetical protein